jgi:cellulose synthase/poly-beta-1,6-N-acetylglucosamine synthase-like glycosyltransferase
MRCLPGEFPFHKAPTSDPRHRAKHPKVCYAIRPRRGTTWDFSDRNRSMTVSVVIPAYNQARLLARLLDSLAAMKDAPPFEIIVVDDASPDDTGAVMAAWIAAHPDVTCRYFRQERNQGPGSARNRGVEEAWGDFVAFTDTDCVAGARWIRALLSGFTDDSIVGVGGPVSPFNPESLFAVYNTVNGTLQPNVTRDCPIPYLVTCNCAYRREALREVGGFPADIHTPGGEDVAASIALYKRGYRFAFAPDAQVRHDFRDTWRSFTRTWRNYGFGCGLVARRMLSPAERNPQWQQWEGENHWSVLAIRPTVTGVRSLAKDLRWFWNRSAGHNLEAPMRVRLLFVRAVERICYLKGWRRNLE